MIAYWSEEKGRSECHHHAVLFAVVRVQRREHTAKRHHEREWMHLGEERSRGLWLCNGQTLLADVLCMLQRNLSDYVREEGGWSLVEFLKVIRVLIREAKRRRLSL